MISREIICSLNSNLPNQGTNYTRSSNQDKINGKGQLIITLVKDQFGEVSNAWKCVFLVCEVEKLIQIISRLPHSGLGSNFSFSVRPLLTLIYQMVAPALSAAYRALFFIIALISNVAYLFIVWIQHWNVGSINSEIW